jgi:RimJ/RimL family protein N-acetyltransferase
MGKAKAYRVETDRLVMRCYQPGDAGMVSKAINQSLDHLRAWMPWAKEFPEDLADTRGRLKSFRDQFYAGEDYTFGIFNKKETELIGSAGLHTRIGPGAREIGYWIHAKHVRKGYAKEAVSALIKTGFDIEKINHIEIHCDLKNRISQKIPQALGFKIKATLKNDRVDASGGPRDTVIWLLQRAEYRLGPLRNMRAKAYDKAGNLINFQ